MGKEKKKPDGKKPKKWRRPRHRVYYQLERFLFRFYSGPVLHYRGKVFDNSGRPYLVIHNHQSYYDQNMMYTSLKRQTYTVATEDIFTNGRLSRLIAYLQAPIPFRKSMADVTAVMTLSRIVREGCSIQIAPEGARTFTGESLRIDPSIAKLIKLLKIPVVFFVLHGAYDTYPRYAAKVRRVKGGIRGGVTRVMEYDEYRDMSVEELTDIVNRELYVDESDDGAFVKGRHLAEYLERAVYRCPVCGALGTLHSRLCDVTCSSCGAVAHMDGYRHFQDGFPVHTVKEWIEDQQAYVNGLEIPDECTEPVTRERASLRILLPAEYRKETIATDVEARLYLDRLEVGDRVWRYSDVDAMTACNDNKLNFYEGGKTYQLTGDTAFNASKYVNIYYHYRNVKEGGDGFLGI